MFPTWDSRLCGVLPLESALDRSRRGGGLRLLRHPDVLGPRLSAGPRASADSQQEGNPQKVRPRSNLCHQLMSLALRATYLQGLRTLCEWMAGSVSFRAGLRPAIGGGMKLFPSPRLGARKSDRVLRSFLDELLFVVCARWYELMHRAGDSRHKHPQRKVTIRTMKTPRSSCQGD